MFWVHFHFIGDPLLVEVSAMDNIMNSRYSIDSWSPAPSPDELVIQKRGRRRRTIVWSPDVDAKRDSLFRCEFSLLSCCCFNSLFFTLVLNFLLYKQIKMIYFIMIIYRI